MGGLLGDMQLSVSLKSPLGTMLLTVRLLAPRLINVTSWAGLVVPTACGPNVYDVLEKRFALDGATSRTVTLPLVPAEKFATYTSPVVASFASAKGWPPVGNVNKTVSVFPSMTVTLFEPSFATYTRFATGSTSTFCAAGIRTGSAEFPTVMFELIPVPLTTERVAGPPLGL